MEGQVIKLPEVLQIKKSKNPLKRLFGGKSSKVSSSPVAQSQKSFKDDVAKVNSRKNFALLDRVDSLCL